MDRHGIQLHIPFNCREDSLFVFVWSENLLLLNLLNFENSGILKTQLQKAQFVPSLRNIYFLGSKVSLRRILYNQLS